MFTLLDRCLLQEATEDLVRAHFSRWGTVTDVYFPRHKKTLKRRPFCFVTFASVEVCGGTCRKARAGVRQQHPWGAAVEPATA